jgi:hypothetical protein
MSVKCAEKPMGIKWSGPFLVLQSPWREDAQSRVILHLPPLMKLDHTDYGRGRLRTMRSTRLQLKKEKMRKLSNIRMMNSDVTLVNEVEEDVAVIYVDDVCMHYPKIRAYMKAVCVAHFAAEHGQDDTYDASCLVGESLEEDAGLCRQIIMSTKGDKNEAIQAE